MAHALGVARDSIVGYWKPEDSEPKTPQRPSEFDALKYLSGPRRFEVLLGEALSRFSLEITETGASLKLSRRVICSITKPSDAELWEQMIWVRNYADLRGDRIAEITEQTGEIIPFFGSAGLINESRRKTTWEILSLVQSICLILEMRIKHYCWSPRPIDFAEEVQPIIQTPDHSTFPSGHATEAFALATVLYHLMNGTRLRDLEKPEPPNYPTPPMVVRIAHRIAVNRTVAGVHFPVDSAAGAMLGTAIGEAVIALATGTKTTVHSYGPGQSLCAGDFTQKWFLENHAGEEGVGVEPLPLLAVAYDRACNEWRDPNA